MLFLCPFFVTIFFKQLRVFMVFVLEVFLKTPEFKQEVHDVFSLWLLPQRKNFREVLWSWFLHWLFFVAFVEQFIFGFLAVCFQKPH